MHSLFFIQHLFYHWEAIRQINSFGVNKITTVKMEKAYSFLTQVQKM